MFCFSFQMFILFKTSNVVFLSIQSSESTNNNTLDIKGTTACNFNSRNSCEINEMEVKLAGMHSNVGCMEADLAEYDLRASMIAEGSSSDDTDTILEEEEPPEEESVAETGGSGGSEKGNPECNGAEADDSINENSTTDLLHEIAQTINAIEEAQGGVRVDYNEVTEADMNDFEIEDFDFGLPVESEEPGITAPTLHMHMPETMTSPIAEGAEGCEQESFTFDADAKSSVEGEFGVEDDSVESTAVLTPKDAHMQQPSDPSLNAASLEIVPLNFSKADVILDASALSVKSQARDESDLKDPKIANGEPIPSNMGNLPLEVTVEATGDMSPTEPANSSIQLDGNARVEVLAAEPSALDGNIVVPDSAITLPKVKTANVVELDTNSKPAKVKKRKSGGFHFHLPKFGGKKSSRHSDVSLDTNDLEDDLPSVAMDAATMNTEDEVKVDVAMKLESSVSMDVDVDKSSLQPDTGVDPSGSNTVEVNLPKSAINVEPDTSGVIGADLNVDIDVDTSEAVVAIGVAKDSARKQSPEITTDGNMSVVAASAKTPSPPKRRRQVKKAFTLPSLHFKPSKSPGKVSPSTASPPPGIDSAYSVNGEVSMSMPLPSSEYVTSDAPAGMVSLPDAPSTSADGELSLSAPSSPAFSSGGAGGVGIRAGIFLQGDSTTGPDAEGAVDIPHVTVEGKGDHKLELDPSSTADEFNGDLQGSPGAEGKPIMPYNLLGGFRICKCWMVA